jgi:hypothetical protein
MNWRGLHWRGLHWRKQDAESKVLRDRINTSRFDYYEG